MTTEDRLNDLITAKADMKSAIESKGVEVTGGLTTYADAIRSIETNGIIEGLDFTEIGYTKELNYKCNNDILDQPRADLAYSKELQSQYDPNSTYDLFESNERLVYAPSVSAWHFANMFSFCQNLKYVGQIYSMGDFAQTLRASGMFYHCESLKEVPLFDTEWVYYMNNMFDSCYSLTSVPTFNTRNVTNMNSMFLDCGRLKYVPAFNTGNVTNTEDMFNNCHNLTDIGGLIDLGKVSNLKITNMFRLCTTITRESCLNIFNNLYDRAAAGYNVLTLKFEQQVLKRLTDTDIAIATNKGWTITS